MGIIFSVISTFINNLNREKTPIPVVMGPMNGKKDKHPITILSVCHILKTPLPERAICKHQPSHYIKSDKMDGELSTIVAMLGKKMPKIEPEVLEEKYIEFKEKFLLQENLSHDSVNFTVYFCDWLLYAYTRGFCPGDYFNYEFYNKEPDIRDTFVEEEYRQFINQLCTSKQHRWKLNRKAAFNRTFKDFVKRDWVFAPKAEFEEFEEFVKRHELFFAKPVGMSQGHGARIINRNDYTIEDLYELCKNERLIAEEIIKQHESLAAFNKSTINTIRITTFLLPKQEPKVMAATIRFGRDGNVVDNFHSDGVGAVVDVETGIIISEAINQRHMRTPVHPDSKKMIVGFQIPEWDKVIETVKAAALVVPQMRHVGWDIALTENGTVELIEGNSGPGFILFQSSLQKGGKHIYEPLVQELAKRKKMVPPKNKPLKVKLPAPKKKAGLVKRIIRKSKKLIKSMV